MLFEENPNPFPNAHLIILYIVRRALLSPEAIVVAVNPFMIQSVGATKKKKKTTTTTTT